MEILFIILALIMIILLIIDIKINKDNKEIEMDNNIRKNKIDLESITKNIERDYKPSNIKLTSYEQEQEDNAIISYEELVKKSNEDNNLKYDSNYKNDADIDVKKIDLDDNIKENKCDKVISTNIDINLMNYEKEEAFLRALKTLQENLVR